MTFKTCIFLPAVRKSLQVKKRTQLILMPLQIEKICVLYDHQHPQSNELSLRVTFVQNSGSNNIKIFVMQQKREISIFWAAKFLSNIKRPFSGCGCEFLFKK